MNKLNLMLVVVSTVVFCGCLSTEETKTKGVKLEAPPSGVIDIKDKKLVIVSVGDKMYADMRVHASVGSTARYRIDDPKIVKMVSCKLTYLYPDRMKSGMTGGDRANRRYIFEAIQPGTTEIRLIQDFRGSIEKEFIVKVQVK